MSEGENEAISKVVSSETLPWVTNVTKDHCLPDMRTFRFPITHMSSVTWSTIINYWNQNSTRGSYFQIIFKHLVSDSKVLKEAGAIKVQQAMNNDLLWG